MQLKEILKNCETRMQKAVESVRHELVKVRTGKATTALLDTVKVDAYGTLMPLNQVAHAAEKFRQREWLSKFCRDLQAAMARW